MGGRVGLLGVEAGLGDGKGARGAMPLPDRGAGNPNRIFILPNCLNRKCESRNDRLMAGN